MLVPAHAPAGAKCIGDLRFIFETRRDDVEGAGNIERSERKRLLRRELIALRGRIVGDIAACGVGVEPLTDIALRRIRFLRQFRRRQSARARHGLIQPPACRR